MLATFNLQLSTLDLSAETPATQGIPPIDGSAEPTGFAALLQVRVTDTANPDGAAGDALPLGGNGLPLPEPDVEITVDGVSLEAVSEGDTPVLPVADEQPWESLVTPSALDVREALPGTTVTTQPVPEPTTGVPAQPVPTLTPNSLPGRPTPNVAVDTASVTAEIDTASAKPIVAPQPLVTTDLPRDTIVDPRDIRVVPGVQAAVAKDIQAREVNVTPVQSAFQDDGQPVLQDTVARATAAPLTQPSATVEEGLEALRPVVQAGVTQAATPTPTMQPAALANLAAATAAPQADSTFASTLQQQAADLIQTPVRDASWGDRIGERVVMMANNQLKTAEIRLTPAELGPVRIQVNVDDGAANITFQAQHAITREAIEQALPRLREMFAESGLSLGQTSVGEQNVAGNRDGKTGGEARAAGQGDEFVSADDDATPEHERLTRRHEGLLDTFV